MVWSSRRLIPEVMVYTKKDKDLIFNPDTKQLLPSIPIRRFPIKDIIKITTSNSIKDIAGTFTIELVWRTDKAGNVIYYDFLRALDIIDISLDGINTTMVGYIDKIHKIRTIKNDKPQRAIRIIGKSLAGIWQFDLVKYFKNTVGIPSEFLQRNLNLQLGNIKLEFYNQSASYAIKTLYKQLPAIDIEYAGRKRLNDFIDVGSELFNRKGETQFNLGLDPYSGTIEDYFKKYVGEPINELWSDSKDGKLYLRMRPFPFSIKSDRIPIERDVDYPQVTKTKKIKGFPKKAGYSNWESINNWMSPRDESDEKRVNPWILDGQVITEDFSKSHERSYSIFGVLPTEFIYGKGTEYQMFPPLIVHDLYSGFGSRDMIIRLGFIPINKDKTLGAGVDKISKYYRNKLFLWNKDNHNLESGFVTMKCNPNIRCGDRAHYMNKQYYVIKATNTWVYGQPTMGTLTLDRGMDESERTARYDVGVEYLKSQGQWV